MLSVFFALVILFKELFYTIDSAEFEPLHPVTFRFEL